jgi:hypothetical protein
MRVTSHADFYRRALSEANFANLRKQKQKKA